MGRQTELGSLKSILAQQESGLGPISFDNDQELAALFNPSAERALMVLNKATRNKRGLGVSKDHGLIRYYDTLTDFPTGAVINLEDISELNVSNQAPVKISEITIPIKQINREDGIKSKKGLASNISLRLENNNWEVGLRYLDKNTYDYIDIYGTVSSVTPIRIGDDKSEIQITFINAETQQLEKLHLQPNFTSDKYGFGFSMVDSKSEQVEAPPSGVRDLSTVKDFSHPMTVLTGESIHKSGTMVEVLALAKYIAKARESENLVRLQFTSARNNIYEIIYDPKNYTVKFVDSQNGRSIKTLTDPNELTFFVRNKNKDEFGHGGEVLLVRTKSASRDGYQDGLITPHNLRNIFDTRWILNRRDLWPTPEKTPSLASGINNIVLLPVNSDIKIPININDINIKDFVDQLTTNIDVLRAPKIELPEDTEGIKVLKNTEFHADSFNGSALNSDIIKREGLQPEYKTEIGGKTIWFSQPYDTKHNGRIAVLAYVEDTNGKFIARTYYRSNSTGVWRYLPQYRERGGRVVWYGKGRDEVSITLPIKLQKTLAAISEKGMPIRSISDAELIFAGTARKIVTERHEDISYFEQVNERARVIGGISNHFTMPGTKTKPEDLIFASENDEPDINKAPKMTWQQETELYGEITIEVYPSKDGKLDYLFCKTANGEVWIAGAEDASTDKIGTTGLKKDWIDLGDLATPLFEYDSQVGGYGNFAIRNGNYVSMNDYLSEIAIIKRYKEIHLS